MTESKTETKTEIIRFVKVKGDTDILLQATFEKMMSEIADVRSRNLLRNHVEHYSQVEPYLNDTTLVGQWHGAGKISEVVIQNFFNKFYQAYLRIAGKGHKKAVLGLISMDYPFLEDKELEIVKSYLETQGHYPMLFIATRFLRRSKDRTTRIIARINGITGRHENMHALAEEYGLSRERIRQLSLKSIVESSPCPLVWSISRWEGYPFFHDPLLTTKNTDWENLRRAEHLEDIDFYSVLSIFSQLRSIKIVAVLADGTDILGRRGEDKGWDKAKIILAYDRRYNFFRFGNALAYIGHEVSLQRTTDKHLSLRSFVGEYIKYPFDEIIPQIANIMVEVLPLFKGVEIVGDDIILRANHTNYFEEIYQILLHKGEAMTVDEIFAEFKRLHPEDHHNDSNFVRSYMLRDKRIEAVGSKSTYQLREWGLFAGALSDLAVYLLQQSDEPMTANDLCRLMATQRTNTTLNSCSTSIYLAVVDGRLLYYADAEKGTNFVGIADHTYDERFLFVRHALSESHLQSLHLL